MAFSNDSPYYLAWFLLLAFGNPVMNNLLAAKTFTSLISDEKGKMTGIMEAFNDLGSLFFLSVSWLLVDTAGSKMTCVMIGVLSLIEIFVFYSTDERDHAMKEIHQVE